MDAPQNIQASFGLTPSMCGNVHLMLAFSSAAYLYFQPQVHGALHLLCSMNRKEKQLLIWEKMKKILFSPEAI